MQSCDDCWWHEAVSLRCMIRNTPKVDACSTMILCANSDFVDVAASSALGVQERKRCDTLSACCPHPETKHNVSVAVRHVCGL
jgi:hypothetical protein